MYIKTRSKRNGNGTTEKRTANTRCKNRNIGKDDDVCQIDVFSLIKDLTGSLIRLATNYAEDFEECKRDTREVRLLKETFIKLRNSVQFTGTKTDMSEQREFTNLLAKSLTITDDEILSKSQS